MFFSSFFLFNDSINIKRSFSFNFMRFYKFLFDCLCGMLWGFWRKAIFLSRVWPTTQKIRLFRVIMLFRRFGDHLTFKNHDEHLSATNVWELVAANLSLVSFMIDKRLDGTNGVIMLDNWENEKQRISILFLFENKDRDTKSHYKRLVGVTIRILSL